jgi:hypothetical protein
MKITTSQLKNLIKREVYNILNEQIVKEGGPGSGQKGHKTAEDPKQQKNINNEKPYGGLTHDEYWKNINNKEKEQYGDNNQLQNLSPKQKHERLKRDIFNAALDTGFNNETANKIIDNFSKNYKNINTNNSYEYANKLSYGNMKFAKELNKMFNDTKK